MAVIPFIPGKTVVTTAEKFNPKGGAVLIREFDEGQLEKQGASNATYDLRVGDKYQDHRDNGPVELAPGAEFPLLPGEAIIIQALEQVHFPNSVFGQIVPKVSLLQVGVSNTSSKIDPGYDGPLLITVFNLGKKEHRFKHGAPFCNLYLLSVDDSGVRPYGGTGKQLLGARTGRFWRLIRDSIQRNAGIIGTLALAVSTILIIMQFVGATHVATLPSHHAP